MRVGAQMHSTRVAGIRSPPSHSVADDQAMDRRTTADLAANDRCCETGAGVKQ